MCYDWGGMPACGKVTSARITDDAAAVTCERCREIATRRGGA